MFMILTVDMSAAMTRIRSNRSHSFGHVSSTSMVWFPCARRRPKVASETMTPKWPLGSQGVPAGALNEVSCEVYNWFVPDLKKYVVRRFFVGLPAAHSSAIAH